MAGVLGEVHVVVVILYDDALVKDRHLAVAGGCGAFLVMIGQAWTSNTCHAFRRNIGRLDRNIVLLLHHWGFGVECVITAGRFALDLLAWPSLLLGCLDHAAFGWSLVLIGDCPGREVEADLVTRIGFHCPVVPVLVDGATFVTIEVF